MNLLYDHKKKSISKDENNLIAETAITEGLMKLDKKNKKIKEIIKNFKENLIGKLLE